MQSLEELIRQRQDKLRGRPEDWIDRFVPWCRRQDWIGTTIIAWGLVGQLIVLGYLIWH
jgi:hypothetical protein